MLYLRCRYDRLCKSQLLIHFLRYFTIILIFYRITAPPELNRIELLWHKMKYEWLKFKLYTPDELEWAIDEIGKGFGNLYKQNF